MYDCCRLRVLHPSCNNPRGKLSGKLWNTDLCIYVCMCVCRWVGGWVGVCRASGNSLFVLSTSKIPSNENSAPLLRYQSSLDRNLSINQHESSVRRYYTVYRSLVCWMLHSVMAVSKKQISKIVSKNNRILYTKKTFFDVCSRKWFRYFRNVRRLLDYFDIYTSV